MNRSFCSYWDPHRPWRVIEGRRLFGDYVHTWENDVRRLANHVASIMFELAGADWGDPKAFIKPDAVRKALGVPWREVPAVFPTMDGGWFVAGNPFWNQRWLGTPVCSFPILTTRERLIIPTFFYEGNDLVGTAEYARALAEFVIEYRLPLDGTDLGHKVKDLAACFVGHWFAERYADRKLRIAQTWMDHPRRWKEARGIWFRAWIRENREAWDRAKAWGVQDAATWRARSSALFAKINADRATKVEAQMAVAS